MIEFFEKLFDSEFMPHGGCYFWQPEILWLHVGSDALIALAYYSIPAALWYFVKKREDLKFSWIFVMFGAFIFACGTTHLLGMWTTWHSTYRLEGVVKLATAGISVVTAAVLWPLIPRALALPSPRQLAASNQALQDEILERQRAEQRARTHLEQLAHVDRINSLGEMSASLGHELHQPLGAIVNFARGCERTLAAGGDPAELEGILRKITAQAERAAEIVRRTRAFSSRRELQRQPVDMNAMLSEVADLVNAVTRQHGAEIRIERMSGLPPILLDRIQIQQVVVNLVKNGIEAMADAPADRRLLKIYARHLGSPEAADEGAEDDGAWFELNVVDQGGDRLPEDLEKLFAPFYSTKTDGMGMGLAISRSIVEAHGGRLFAVPNQFEGLTFRLQIPLTSPSDERPEDPA